MNSQYKETYEEIQQIGRDHCDGSLLTLVRHRECKHYRMAKKVLLHCESDHRYHEQILKETQLLKNLRHPHLLNQYEVYWQNIVVLLGQVCVQLEGDMGHYLMKRKQRQEFLSQKLILSWIMQILMGLEYIHSKNVIHRMLKISNVYMNHQGDLKIGSFGAAAVLENTLEKAMSIVTEPCFMSPEMVEGQAYDYKVDIWALGCLTYQMATFQAPYKMGSLPKLYNSIVKMSAPELPIKYSKHVGPIYKKMMRKNPQNRPSASELLQEQVFMKLLNEYTKKKKISALDLRDVVPKQLGIHRKRILEMPKRKCVLPPLYKKQMPVSKLELGLKEANNAIIKSPSSMRKNLFEKIISPKPNRSPYSRVKNPYLRAQSEEKRKKSRQSRQKGKRSNSIQRSAENKRQIKTQQSPNLKQINEPQRLTEPNFSEADYIALICQVKLQLLSKKYQPNLSKITQGTVEFDELE